MEMSVHTDNQPFKVIFTIRVFKIDAVIWNAFLKCVCGATLPQTGRLLPNSAGFIHT